MKKKICRNCKLFVEDAECRVCKGNQFNSTAQGRVSVVDVKNSVVARKMGFTAEGDYAIKSR